MITEEEVIDVLYDILDPEIQINIYDLGIIYGINIDGDKVVLDITLTSAGCPLADVLEDNISSAFVGKNVSVSLNWVWLPAWDINRITTSGRDQLVASGFPMKLLEKSTWKKREKVNVNG